MAGDKRALIIHPSDSVATAIEDIAPGDTVRLLAVSGEEAGAPVVARQAIPFGHKLALRDLQEGEPVIKYGEVIGRTIAPVAAGEHMHVHNLRGLRGRGDQAAAAASALSR